MLRTAEAEMLEKVRLLLYEPQAEVGNPMTAMLRAEGFRATEHIHSLDAARKALEQREPPHVLVADIDAYPDEVVRFGRAIRRGRAGTDPFVGLIATQSDVTRESLKTIVGAGFDYILDKPYSPLSVLAHVQDLARKPRRFVASAGYVGPERRTRRVETDAHTVLDVPNRLAALFAQEAIDEAAYAETVKHWQEMLAEAGPET